MFRGQFVHSVDAKGRISLPARFRDVLLADKDARFVLTPALFDPCLHLYPMRAWEEFEQKVSELPSLDPNAVRVELYANAVDAGGPIRAEWASGRLATLTVDAAPLPLRGAAPDPFALTIGESMLEARLSHGALIADGLGLTGLLVGDRVEHIRIDAPAGCVLAPGGTHENVTS